MSAFNFSAAVWCHKERFKPPLIYGLNGTQHTPFPRERIRSTTVSETFEIGKFALRNARADKECRKDLGSELQLVAQSPSVSFFVGFQSFPRRRLQVAISAFGIRAASKSLALFFRERKFASQFAGRARDLEIVR